MFWQGNLIDAEASHQGGLYSLKTTGTEYIKNQKLYYQDLEIADITSGGTNYNGGVYCSGTTGYCVADFPTGAEIVNGSYVTHMEKRLYVKNTLYATGNYDLVSDYGFTSEGTPINVSGFISVTGNQCSCEMYWFQVSYADGSFVWLNQDGEVNATPPTGTCCGNMILTRNGTVHDKNYNVIANIVQQMNCCGEYLYSANTMTDHSYVDFLSPDYGLMRFDMQTFKRMDDVV